MQLEETYKSMVEKAVNEKKEALKAADKNYSAIIKSIIIIVIL